LRRQNEQEGRVVTAVGKPVLPEYIPLEGTESPYGYRPGGYHPVDIGDIYADRYCIVHKLGRGGWSTIWLARDQKAERYVAVKIASAGTGFHETQILKDIGMGTCTSPPHDGQSAIPQVLDQFKICGPNGEHNAMVTPVAMMSLMDAKEGSYVCLFQLPVARAIAAQLARAVAYVHDRGIVHGGKPCPGCSVLIRRPGTDTHTCQDLHTGNVLLRLPSSLDALSPEQLYARYREPDPQEVRCMAGRPIPKGVPTHCYHAIWLGRPSEDVSLLESRVLVTDFGVSHDPAKNPRLSSYIPVPLTPPEVWYLPKEPISFPADIWSLACTLWSVVAQRDLFESFVHSKNEIMEEQIDALGKLPSEWWERFEARPKRSVEDELERINYGYRARTLTDRFEDTIREPREEAGMETMGSEEKEAFLKLLRSMLAWRPNERISVEQVLQSEWMQKWAFPELENIDRITR
jgi:serine/threonine protein kinase